MAIKYTYPRKAVPSNGDLILISDSVDNNKTKTISIDTLPGGGSTGVFSIFSTNGVSTGIQDALSIDSNTGSVTFSINKYDGGDNAGYVPPGGLGSTYLRGDGTWGTPASGFSIEYEGSALASDPSLINFTGPGVVATENAGEVTINIPDAYIIEDVRISEQVSKGDALYVSGQGFGSNPGIPTVGRADSTDGVKMPVVGLALEDYSQNTNGKMIVTGILDGINTNVITGASGSSINEIVYIDNSGSTNNLTLVKPINTDLIQNVGIITKTGANGSIQVSCIGRTNDLPNIPQGSIWIGDNDGVPEQLSIGTSGEVLTSNGLSAEWSSSAFVSSINFGTTGLTPNTATGGIVDVDGTLVAANGGTGFASYTVGDLLYADSATSLAKLSMSAPDAGKVLAVNLTGDAPEWVTQSGISEVTADTPIVVANGTTAPDISIPEANTSTDGYLSSTWWNNFKVSGGVGQLQFTDSTGNAFDSGNLKHIKVSGNDQGGLPTSITTLEIGASTDNLNGGVLKLYGSNFSGASGLVNDNAAIEFVSASATNTLRLRANPSADYTITLPSGAPTSSQPYLSFTTTGEGSWSAGVQPGGDAEDVQFKNSSGNFDGNSYLTLNSVLVQNGVPTRYRRLTLGKTDSDGVFTGLNKAGRLELRGSRSGPGGYEGGSIMFYNEDDEKRVIIRGSKEDNTVAENYVLTLPAAAPTGDRVLQSDVSGNLSWAVQSSATAPGNSGDIQFSSGPTNQDFQSNDGFNFTEVGDAKILQLANTGVTSGKKGVLKLRGYETLDKPAVIHPAYIQFINGFSGETLDISAYPTATYEIKLPASPPSGDGQVLESDSNGQLEWVNIHGQLLDNSIYKTTGGTVTNPSAWNYPFLSSASSDFGQVEFDPASTGTGTGVKVYGKVKRPNNDNNYVRVVVKLNNRTGDTASDPEKVMLGLHNADGDFQGSAIQYGWTTAGDMEMDDLSSGNQIHQLTFSWDILVSDLLLTDGNPAASGNICYFYLKGICDNASSSVDRPSIIFGDNWKVNPPTTQADNIAGGPLTIDVYLISDDKYSVNNS